jgi:zinc transporter 7
MPSRLSLLLCAVITLLLVCQTSAGILETKHESVASLSNAEIDEMIQVYYYSQLQLELSMSSTSYFIAGDQVSVYWMVLNSTQSYNMRQQCPLVQALNQHKVATHPPTSSVTSRIFAILFPGSPAVNALLATLYISGPPNFLLALCPPNIDPSSLSVMVAFAVGGLLGDTLFHLLPEIFLGEDAEDHVRFVLVEPNKNLLLGVAIMVGFITFVAMDKGLRIATGGQDLHDHGHAHGKLEGGEKAAASGVDSKGMFPKPHTSSLARLTTPQTPPRSAPASLQRTPLPLPLPRKTPTPALN